MAEWYLGLDRVFPVALQSSNQYMEGSRATGLVWILFRECWFLRCLACAIYRLHRDSNFPGACAVFGGDLLERGLFSVPVPQTPVSGRTLSRLPYFLRCKLLCGLRIP